MKIKKSLQASVHLTIDERKTLENAVDLLIEMSADLDNFICDCEKIAPENVITMDEDAVKALYLLEKILFNIEK